MKPHYLGHFQIHARVTVSKGMDICFICGHTHEEYFVVTKENIAPSNSYTINYVCEGCINGFMKDDRHSFYDFELKAVKGTPVQNYHDWYAWNIYGRRLTMDFLEGIRHTHSYYATPP